MDHNEKWNSRTNTSSCLCCSLPSIFLADRRARPPPPPPRSSTTPSTTAGSGSSNPMDSNANCAAPLWISAWCAMLMKGALRAIPSLRFKKWLLIETARGPKNVFSMCLWLSCFWLSWYSLFLLLLVSLCGELGLRISELKVKVLSVANVIFIIFSSITFLMKNLET